MAAAFHASGMFPDIRSTAQAIVKIQAGRELGFNPIYSMTKIYIVKGRVMVAAETMGAMVKRSGRYDYKVITLTDTECTLDFTENGKSVYISRFTIEDAKRADLVIPGSGWYKWPRAMLMSKALSQGARIVAPDVISGTYTPEDLGYSTNPETQTVEGIAVVEPIIPAPFTRKTSTPQDADIDAENDRRAEEAAEAAKTSAAMQTAVENADQGKAFDGLKSAGGQTVTEPPKETPKTAIQIEREKKQAAHQPCKNIGDFLNSCLQEFGLPAATAIKEAGYARKEDIDDAEVAYQNVKGARK